jgi:hypothetical protein
MKIDGTTVSFDLYDLCLGAKPDQLAAVADAMALNSAIRKNVVDSLLEGITEQESMPNDSDMDPERKRLIVGQDVLRDERIKHLENQERRLTERLTECERVNRLVWDVYHSTMQSDWIAKDRIYNALTSRAKL